MEVKHYIFKKLLHRVHVINATCHQSDRASEWAALRESVTDAAVEEVSALFDGIILQEPGNKAPAVSFNEKMKMAMHVDGLDEKINKAMKELTWYERELLLLYVEYGNFRSMGAQTGIPFQSIAKTVKNARQRLKTIISNS